MNIEETLKKNNQTHILDALNALSGAEHEKLGKQIEQVNWDEISQLVKDYVLRKPVTEIPPDLSPAPYFPLKPKDAEQAEFYRKAFDRGVELIRNGKTAALTVAGGQGTRLGFDGPKGTYPITPVLHKTLFQYFAESLGRVSEKYGHRIPWFIMTSELNDKATREFFQAHDFFGLPKDSVQFFTQGFMPAIDYSGKVLMSAKDSIALTPDGHGGTLLALRKFTKEDFGRLHPAGAIGRAVTMRVGDAMRSGDRLATVTKDFNVRDTLLKMTACRSGSAIIVDDEMHPIGIFTDGDFRRRAGVPDILTRNIAEVMTHNPASICQDALAVEVLRLVEARKVDDIIVTDADGKVVGVVDIQDLPGLKLM